MRLILDTNIFVAAGFNARSSSARLIRDIREGKHQLVWDERTKNETRAILKKIPPLNWKKFEELFSEQSRFEGEVPSEGFKEIDDPEDRKFAALASASGAVIVTNDSHFLDKRSRLKIDIRTPSEID